MNLPFDLLLGRTTFEIWEPYWPQHADAWPGVNTATTYVASNTRTSRLIFSTLNKLPRAVVEPCQDVVLDTTGEDIHMTIAI